MENDKNAALEELGKDAGGNVWSALAYLSQHFDLGPEITHKAQEIVANSTAVGDGETGKLAWIIWNTLASWLQLSGIWSWLKQLETRL